MFSRKIAIFIPRQILRFLRRAADVYLFVGNEKDQFGDRMPGIKPIIEGIRTGFEIIFRNHFAVTPIFPAIRSFVREWIGLLIIGHFIESERLGKWTRIFDELGRTTRAGIETGFASRFFAALFAGKPEFHFNRSWRNNLAVRKPGIGANRSTLTICFQMQLGTQGTFFTFPFGKTYRSRFIESRVFASLLFRPSDKMLVTKRSKTFFRAVTERSFKKADRVFLSIFYRAFLSCLFSLPIFSSSAFSPLTFFFALSDPWSDGVFFGSSIPA